LIVTPDKFLFVKSVFDKSAPVKFAFSNIIVFVKFAPDKFLFDKLTPDKLTPDKSTPGPIN